MWKSETHYAAPKPVEYRIVRGNPKEVAGESNALIAEGWELNGPLYMYTPPGHQVQVFAQGMVKYDTSS